VVLLILLALFEGTAAHSWPERTIRIAPNGTMVGLPGYERQHWARGTPGISDANNTWLLPPNGRPDGKIIHPDDKIVREGQRTLKYSDEFPMLKVAPGDFVAISYLENGHVSGPDKEGLPIKPINRGTVYLYGTTENDLTNYNLVDIHLKWTADGTGGDGKGKLLATRNYDDGQCYEAIPATGDTEGIITHRKSVLNNDVNLMCQSDLQIPDDLAPNTTFTVIWVWDWPTMSDRGAAVSPATYHANSSDYGDIYVKEPEIYTGVVDFEVVDSCDASLGEIKGPHCVANTSAAAANKKGVARVFAAQEVATLAGVKAQMANNFLVKVPQAGINVSTATANPSNIPLGALIGTTSQVAFPLPTSIQNAVVAAPGTYLPTASAGPAAPAASATALPNLGGGGGGG
ncbi:hypothetical protein B0T17DRAFT_470515, partial [Bombardia bombarda]